MECLPNIIQGGSHIDVRGILSFFNDFDMSAIKRFYSIQHPRITVKRGWRGHKIEQRWFCVTQGVFRVNLVKIDHWEKPSSNLIIHHFELLAEDNQILHVPAGYASNLQAIEINSKVLVFADHGMEHAKNDDYLYPNNYFKKQ